MKISHRIFAGVSLLALNCTSALAQQVRFARCHHHYRREATPAPRSGIRRGDQGEGLGVDGLVGAACRAA